MDIQDRRVFERIEARFAVRFLNPADGKEGEAETINLSANGVGFITEYNLSVKSPLEMWLNIPDQHLPLYARGEVVSTRLFKGHNRQRIGVRLENARLMALARILWLKSSV